MGNFVSRAGLKLEFAIASFGIDAAGKTCADLGCNAGGFVDCLLQHGAAKVFAIDTGYGVLHWKLRNDARVVVMERTNAMHAHLPEPIDLITIDVAWTKQRFILPAALKMLAADGSIIALIKPHYEADAALLRKGVLPEEHLERVVDVVLAEITQLGLTCRQTVTSPIKGAGGNVEMLAWLRRPD